MTRRIELLVDHERDDSPGTHGDESLMDDVQCPAWFPDNNVVAQIDLRCLLATGHNGAHMITLVWTDVEVPDKPLTAEQQAILEHNHVLVLE